jgi:KDO2-lipid IV(A) lauroyltransferase
MALEALDWLRPDLRSLALDNIRHAAIPDPEGVLRRFKLFAAKHIARLIVMKSSESIASRWQVNGWRYLREAQAAGRPAVLAFFHMGAWEEGLHALANEGIEVLDLTESFPGFPRLHKEVQRRRNLSGHRFLEWRGGAREMLRYLRKGGVVLIAAEVFPNSGGFRMQWLGRETWVDDKAARAAAAAGAILLPVWVEECVGHIEPPIDTADPRRATEELLRLAEHRIREHPHLWIWLHDRWREKPQ